jgi:hypothetical protein
LLEKITSGGVTQIKAVLMGGASAPSSFIVTELVLEPAEIYVGDRVTISAEIMNPSSVSETYNVDLIINGVTLATSTIEVAPGTTETISWYTTEEWNPGTYEVVIGDKTGVFRIIEDTDTTLSLYMESSVLKVGDSATVSGFVSPVLENCRIRIYLRGAGGVWVDLDDVDIDFDGFYFYTWEPLMIGEYYVRTALVDESGLEMVSSDTESFIVEEESMCIIATATYGSEFSPEVQFLRNFRNKRVLNTYVGSNFMVIFNLWYYSFSPSVARVIAESSLLKMVFKIILMPLLRILKVSEWVYTVFTFNPELGVIITGMVTCILISVIYLSLPLILGQKRFNIKIKSSFHKKMILLIIINLLLIGFSEVFRWGYLMKISTVYLVLSIVSETSILILNLFGIYSKILAEIVPNIRKKEK